MPSLVHLPADAPAAEITAVLDRDGALILDDALPVADVDALVAELTWRGVLVLPAAAFAVSRQNMPNAVRVCLGAPRSREAAERGLTLLAETIRQPAGSAAVV